MSRITMAAALHLTIKAKPPVAPRNPPIMWRFSVCKEGQLKQQDRLSLRKRTLKKAWVETAERIQNLQHCRKVACRVRQLMLRL